MTDFQKPLLARAALFAGVVGGSAATVWAAGVGFDCVIQVSETECIACSDCWEFLGEDHCGSQENMASCNQFEKAVCTIVVLPGGGISYEADCEWNFWSPP